MMALIKFTAFLILLSTFTFPACVGGGVGVESIKDITAFTISGIGGTIEANTISLTVPYSTDLTSLTPTITIWGGSYVSPASGVAQDFSSPVVYTVTAADGSTKKYTVTVTKAPSSAKDITAFTISGIGGTIVAKTISLAVLYGTDLISLTPTITITGESVSPASGVAQDFSSPVVYTVTAADGSTKTYTVTVTEAPSSAKDITAFTISGIGGGIEANSINLTVPSGTGLTSLTPTITITGESVSPASGVAQDFLSPVVYTVTAADGSTKTYTVTVKVSFFSYF
jgi:hypothetical protein